MFDRPARAGTRLCGCRRTPRFEGGGLLVRNSVRIFLHHFGLVADLVRVLLDNLPGWIMSE